MGQQSASTQTQADEAAKEAAATRIQSVRRGSLVRRQQSASTQTQVASASDAVEQKPVTSELADAAQADVAAQEAAAIRIQSVRRGSLVRRLQSAGTQTQATENPATMRQTDATANNAEEF